MLMHETYAEVVGGNLHEVSTGRIQTVKDYGVGPFGVKFDVALCVSHYKPETRLR